MKQYELETGTIGFVPVPEDSFGHWVNPVIKQLFHYHTPQLEGMSDIDVHTIDLGSYGFKPLSLFSQLKDEDVKEVMPKITTGHFYAGNYVKWFLYKCFKSGEFDLELATESIQSLAQHLGLDTTQPIFVIFKPR